MGESQSRYSIVERLTQKKLDLISQKLELDEEVKVKAQKAEQLKKYLSPNQKDLFLIVPPSELLLLLPHLTLTFEK